MTDDDAFDPEWLKELNFDDPITRAQFIGQLQLIKAAWKFVETAVRDGDLRAAWGLVHEPLREQLAQQWVIDNGRDIQAFGFDESEVVAGLAADPPSHPLWVHFERVHVRTFRQALPDSDYWAIGTNTRVVGPDLEALYVHDKSQLPPDGLLQPGAISKVCALTFQRVGDEWLLAMVGNNELLDDVF